MTGNNQHHPVVLVVEDNGLIGLALEDDLKEAGYEVAGPFSTCAEATQYVARSQPDAAILDVNLNDGTCWSLADELSRRDVPFMIYSGLSPTSAAMGFQGLVWLVKPAAGKTLLKVLDTVLAQAQLRRDLLADAEERRRAAAELAQVAERLDAARLPTTGTAIREIGHHHTIRSIQQQARGDILKPYRTEEQG